MANSTWGLFAIAVALIAAGLMIWHLRRGD
ncbi:hypothetical protein I41_38010 [Lacipirellula limnantheis]|uniref:Uncharacterized protein n=1 Tax=Lacipirellula limnantheis TaxID=2528024 RepID=A0A517U1U7_9BACT|nr:hypothetical protein I41_38010 [Lacipirellula limnantheis]